LATINFAHPYANPPIVVITAANAESAIENIKWYSPAIGDPDGPTATDFKIVARAPLTITDTYKFNCQVIGAN
jgi:hypothetical protein